MSAHPAKVLFCLRRTRLVLGGFVLAVLLAGCSGAKEAEVSGTVTYKGQKLGSGVVLFTGTHGSATAGINADGTYTVAKAPVGPCKVTVETFAPGGGAAGKGGPKMGTMEVDGKPVPPPGPYVKIPAKYSDVNGSGLSFDVKPGQKNTYEIKLD